MKIKDSTLIKIMLTYTFVPIIISTFFFFMIMFGVINPKAEYQFLADILRGTSQFTIVTGIPATFVVLIYLAIARRFKREPVENDIHSEQKSVPYGKILLVSLLSFSPLLLLPFVSYWKQFNVFFSLFITIPVAFLYIYINYTSNDKSKLENSKRSKIFNFLLVFAAIYFTLTYFL